jgi:hypothetical protein
LQIHTKKHQTQLHEQQLLNVANNLCRFILHEVINASGKYFYDAQALARDPKYIGLREWENQERRATSSSICKE